MIYIIQKKNKYLNSTKVVNMVSHNDVQILTSECIELDLSFLSVKPIISLKKKSYIDNHCRLFVYHVQNASVQINKVTVYKSTKVFSSNTMIHDLSVDHLLT